FDYLNISGIYGLHGRALATAQGIKLANPSLKVISFGGDGDSLGEGLEHTMFAAKRNIDVTLILHNNGNYGLTTGQASPLSYTGYKGLSTPMGNVEAPFHPVTLMMEAGASFIARAYSAKIDHLSSLIQQAVFHKGFSFIEVLQPCVSYNNTYELYNSHCVMMEEVPATDDVARVLAKDSEQIRLGIFKHEIRAEYCEAIRLQDNPLSRSQRFELICGS
ncbi:MAG TPA: thiamine pyrophosphate-dependent enzyme, partial [Candidatus Cloacimonadota bacterium]|nr:thiamine pyrophosphate-dependent enzyme [Candidatus Cloacimonadota bacterium]